MRAAKRMTAGSSGTKAPSLRSATLWAAVAQYSGFVIQFISSVIIARYFLDPAEVGVFSVAFAAAALVQGLQDFGISRYIVALEKVEASILKTAFAVSVVVAAGIVITLLLLAKPVAVFYDNQALFPIMLLIGISYVLTPFAIVPRALLQREMNFRKVAVIDVGANLANGVVSITAAWYGYSAMSLAFGVLGYQVARAVLTQIVRPLSGVFPPNLRGSREMFSYGSWSALLSFVSALSDRAPDLVVGKVISETALGLYSRATGLAVQFRVLVGGPISTVIYPSLARARDRGENLAVHYLRLTAALCAVTWAAMAGLAVASEPLILILYGERWAGAAPILVWIALAQIFYISIPMQVNIGYLLGGWRRVIALTLLDAVLSIAILIFASRYGLWWAAFSRIIHGALCWAIYAVFIQGLVKFRWRDLFAIYAKTAVASIAAVLPLLLAYRFWIRPAELGFFELVTLSGAGVMLWYGVLIAIRHPSARDMTGLLTDGLLRLRRS